MKHELKTKWIKALRSGKYRQGRGRLKYGDRYCCLGVLRHISDPKDTRHSSNTLTYEQMKDYGMDMHSPLHILSNMNDGREPTYGDKPGKKHSFAEIADYIEKNL